MENVFPFLAKLLGGEGFFCFQNEVAQAMYAALGQGYESCSVRK